MTAAGPVLLHGLLEASARRFPSRPAVVSPSAAISYGEIDALAGELAQKLAGRGVGRGARVGVCAPKSIGTVAAIFGVLKAGGAYVPVDASAPARRNAYILRDCGVAAFFVAPALLDGLRAELGRPIEVVAEVPGAADAGAELVLAAVTGEAEPPPAALAGKNLAYILYTSGSTGAPKGVVHSHRTALSFIDWCSETFAPTEADRFSSHAPFHFDLSILDLYVAIKHGAAVVLIGSDLGKQPAALAPYIAEQRISVWYSTPSTLRLLVEHGKMQELDHTALRLVLFAGEVFPIKHLHALRALWPGPRYYNLYGPTETNVCTFFEAPAELPEDAPPLPIGRACSGDATLVADENHGEVPPGEPGELYVSGGSVMLGYWNLPERNAKAFYRDAAGTAWYRTGDVVRDAGGGCYKFLGRRDRMVKRRGYRVELGEIEAALYRHESVTEAAVVAVADQEKGVEIRAFFSWKGDKPPSLIQLKRFCSENLPLYMIPDRFSAQPALPKTSTDKIDYQRLKELG